MPAPQPVGQALPPRNQTFKEQVIPTIDLLRDAIKAGDHARAVELIDYIDLEWAGLNYGFYTQWHIKSEEFLAKRGVSAPDIEGIQGDLLLLVNTQWNPGVPYDRTSELQRYRIHKARLVRELNAPVDVALRTLDEWKEIWRSIHDRDTDYAAGILNAINLRFGEATLEDVFRHIIAERFDARYAKYDVSKFPWDKAFESLVHASIETQRGHLVGPKREGTVELQEFPDRVMLTFSPCATGGRTLFGDHISGTPSRNEAPYYFKVIEGKHDFAWNKPGVCQYCTHCAMMTGKFPIERYGYPLRVVVPPVASDKNGRCSWIMYRNPRDVPAEYYRSLGMTKPGPDEPLGSAGRQPSQASGGQRQ